MSLLRRWWRHAPHTQAKLRSHLYLEALESRVVPYGLTGTAWPRPQLVTISIVPDGTDIGGARSNLNAAFARMGPGWVGQILAAAQSWGAQSTSNSYQTTEQVLSRAFFNRGTRIAATSASAVTTSAHIASWHGLFSLRRSTISASPATSSSIVDNVFQAPDSYQFTSVDQDFLAIPLNARGARFRHVVFP